jgi:predicted negative regulator of RcsB-dependent stress response
MSFVIRTLHPLFRSCLVWSSCIAFGLALTAGSVYGQSAACALLPARASTPADGAYNDGNYTEAEQLYAQALTKSPQDSSLSAALVHTLLHEGKVAQASNQVNAILVDEPHSAATLTALAEVQLRQGQPWQAMQTLDSAADADHCYARMHLIRSRVFRIDSMYASERKEMQAAYNIDPSDPDILRAWQSVVMPAHDIEGIQKSLATMKDLDQETRQKAEASIHSMMPQLYENSQTCKILPSDPSATLPLLPTMEDGKHIDGFRIEVDLPKSKAKLKVDTAASGLFISRALAEANGLQQGADAPAGTVQADSVRIGPLEFRDCMVGVSDTPFAGKADGFIGTDVFASYLITIDPRTQKLSLDPLPPQAGLLPGDRAAPSELADYMPVYHRRQYLLVPVTLNNKSRKLFALDTGMLFSAMTSETAHSISNIKVNFTNPMQTASGPPAQVYRDNFDFQFANLSPQHQNHVIQFDPSAIDHNAGLEVAGLLGFDILHSLTTHLDYRDGLVKFESTNDEAAPAPRRKNETAVASAGNEPDAAACPPYANKDWPTDSTIEARVTGLMDSSHLKPGKDVFVKVVYGLSYPGCSLPEDAILYGHVTAAASSKNPNSSELALEFDHADCQGHQKQELPLRLIGLVAPPDESQRLHDTMPTELAGGARQIGGSRGGSDTVTGTNGRDDNLNPGGPPKTVHPGIVVRMPKVKLEPEGGPGCSARISSSDRSVQLAPGAELILTVEKVAP